MRYAALVKAIQTASAQFQGRAVMAVNQALVLRNWLVGEWILGFEHHGKERAKYGENLLDKLAADLKQTGLKGLDMRTLRDCRGLVRYYPQIRGTLSPEFLAQPDSGDSVPRMSATPSPAFGNLISSGLILPHVPIRQTLSAESPSPLSADTVLRLSWSHLQELITIDEPWKRAFFENECLQANWSVRQLRRQIGSLLYERTGLSTNKKSVIEKARKQERQQDFNDLIRDPYILEFTGLAERPEYLESDLESALLTHLQGFLLELGAGFCFEARQKRITVGRKHDYIDLVFYHRRLRCHVLIDLKIRPFKHGDAGQMNFYLNWWKSNAMEDGDNPLDAPLLAA